MFYIKEKNKTNTVFLRSIFITCYEPNRIYFLFFKRTNKIAIMLQLKS